MSSNFKNIISLVGMSGIGKTTFAVSQNPSKYFHYSVDYAIGEMFLRQQIIQDLANKINLTNGEISNLINKNSISFNTHLKMVDLSLVSAFIGKFGSQKLGGFAKSEFLRRQNLYATAERAATLHLQNIADKIFSMGYEYIINDLTGSICEIIDFNDKNDKVANFLKSTTIKYLPASDDLVSSLIERSKKAPKPLLYNVNFFESSVQKFMKQNNINDENAIDPDEFCSSIFEDLIHSRLEKYQQIANF